jgi:hypothetical protein
MSLNEVTDGNFLTEPTILPLVYSRPVARGKEEFLHFQWVAAASGCQTR